LDQVKIINIVKKKALPA